MGTQWTLGGPPSPSADNANPRWLQFFDGSRSNRPYAGNKPAARQNPPNQPTQPAPEILQPSRCFVSTGGANWGAQPIDRLGAPQRLEHHARLGPGGRRLPLDIRASPSASLRARRGFTPGCQNRVQLWRATLQRQKRCATGRTLPIQKRGTRRIVCPSLFLGAGLISFVTIPHALVAISMIADKTVGSLYRQRARFANHLGAKRISGKLL